MKTSPTARSLKILREMGYLCAIVEKFVRFPPPGHRVDLFGFIDILAVGHGGTLAVQTTTASNVAARIAKIRESPALPILRECGWRVLTHAWRKGGPRGERKVWACTETEVVP